MFHLIASPRQEIFMTQPPWWQTTTIYQIYPRSYADSDNDGIGDLRGIISKLDYIQDLGFETIWISPFFRSPQQDFGYDVSDYLDVAPEYGTMTDVDNLINEVHARGMKILFDLVLNHTSIEHPWFQESRASRENPKRDWYIWRDGRGKRPPNNWKAIPGGSAWHYDETTDQWYFTNFLPFQPDLNWRNPVVKQTMLDAVRFWLDKGVDGFRFDIFHSVYKDAQFRDNPFSPKFLPQEWVAGYFQKWIYNIHQPEAFTLAKELRAILDSGLFPRLMVGEVYGEDRLVKQYIGSDLNGFHMLFSWDLLNFRPTAEFLRKAIQHCETLYPEPYTPVYVFGNHDRKRLISQAGGDLSIAKLLALFQFTVRGVTVTYYGEEIGMEDGGFPASTALDPVGQRYKWIPQFLLDVLGVYVNRDGCRTPMQWDASKNAGFCDESALPWLPVHANRKWANVQDQLEDDGSLLNLYRTLLRLRRETPALRNGGLELLSDPAMDGNILAYRRDLGDDSVLVAINYGKKPVTFENPTGCNQVLLTVRMEKSADPKKIEFPPYSGIILGQ
jgi:alpha-glucosidase